MILRQFSFISSANGTVHYLSFPETMIPMGMTEIQSEGFPSNYPNNTYGIWDIRAPVGFVLKLKFELLDIEKGADYIHIGHGVTYFSSNSTKWTHVTGNTIDILERRTLIFPSSSVTLIFTSDGAIRYSGFLLKCSLIDIDRTPSIGNLVYCHP